jgi:hypothetical protein
MKKKKTIITIYLKEKSIYDYFFKKRKKNNLLIYNESEFIIFFKANKIKSF